MFFQLSCGEFMFKTEAEIVIFYQVGSLFGPGWRRAEGGGGGGLGVQLSVMANFLNLNLSL